MIFCLFFSGKSVWTKLIRNKTAVGYLFNAESYNFNYQFQNNLPELLKLYPVKNIKKYQFQSFVFFARVMNLQLDAFTIP